VDFLVLSKPEIHLALNFFDGMSVIMMLLSVIVAYAAARTGDCEDRHAKLWNISLLLIAAGALGAFLSTDLFFFYAFHELALIPTFLTIGILGRGDRKEIAWKVTIYLALGSIILLAGLLWLVAASGTPDLSFESLLKCTVPVDAQRGIALFLLIGFGILVSLFPFHSWAAPAYASAPAPISMLHAGVLKKFGLYGLLRLHPLVPTGMTSWLELIIVLLLGNILWVGFVTINQKRLDSMLGNSSVMHMGYIFLAIAALIAAQSESANPIAKPAAILLMFGHGVTIAMLFGLADRIERLTGTLELRDLGGLAKQAPKLAFLFGLAAMASIGLPGLANFAGEVMVFIAGFKGWKPDTPPGWVQIATILSLWGLVISAVYMLRAFHHIFQGPTVELTRNASDLSARDRSPAVLLAAVLLIVGLFPNILLQFLEQPEDEPVVAREQAHITQHPRPPQPAGSAPVQPHPSPSQ
jgi:NADH-quinone oxidoreductase subunit M